MALTMIVTDAGRAALVNAQHNGTAPVIIAQCGLTGTEVVPAQNVTALPAEFKRIGTLSGTAVAADTIHLVVRDESADVYSARSIALYLADGTLFAIYGQTNPIVTKAASAIMLLAIDVTFADILASSLTFGDTNFLNPPATTTTLGVVELATSAEATAGSDLSLVPPVKAMRDAVFAWLDARFGVNNALVWNPNNDGAGSGLDAGLFAGQLPAYYTNIVARLGYTPLNATAYTAADILAKFVTVDGAGSGTDADLLDGQQGSYYLAAASYTAADVKTKMLTVDGAGSGFDADLLDGQDGAYYANITGRLGFTPVRQGGGTGQGNNVVYIGWGLSGNPRLKAQVDTTDLGNFVFDSNISDVWRSSNDGAGSGLDADLLDGQDSAYYTNITARLGYTPLNATAYTAADVKAKILTIDGAGSGIDADLLDGQDGAYYANITARLGYTPVNRAGDTMTGPLIVPAGFKILAENAAAGEGGQFVLEKSSLGTLTGDIAFDNNGNLLRMFEIGGTSRGVRIDLTLCAAGAGSSLWHSSNDGAGSGMDADLWRGQTPAQFLAAQFQSGSNANGNWRKLPDGNGGFIIEQWGVITTNRAEGRYTQNLPIPFLTSIENVELTGLNPTATIYQTVVHEWVQTPASLTAFDYFVQWTYDNASSPNSDKGVAWRAIGR